MFILEKIHFVAFSLGEILRNQQQIKIFFFFFISVKIKYLNETYEHLTAI